MTIRMAHLREQGIDFAVFEADAPSHTDADRKRALAQLMAAAREQGLNVEKAALAFTEYGSTTYFGTPDLVRFLSTNWIPSWTHQLSI